MSTAQDAFCRDCFQPTNTTPGSTTLARLYFLEGNGQLDADTTNGILANIISYGFTVANVQCRQSFVDEQDFTVDCDNAVIGEQVANSSNCKACLALAKEVRESRQKLEQDAHQLNPAYQEQVVDPTILDDWNGASGDGGDGVCKYVCRQCVAENVSQNIQMRIVAECSDRLTSEEFLTAFTSGMSLQAETELTKHQEALKTTGLDIQSQDDIKTLSVEMADTIRQMTTIKILNSLNQLALNIQETKIDSGSTSVVLQNVSQALTVSLFASLVSRAYTDTNVQASIDLSNQRQLVQVETSFTDLINSLETTVRTMESLLLSTVGKIMVTIVALLLTVMVVFAAFFFYHPSFIFGSALEAPA